MGIYTLQHFNVTTITITPLNDLWKNPLSAFNFMCLGYAVFPTADSCNTNNLMCPAIKAIIIRILQKYQI